MNIRHALKEHLPIFGPALVVVIISLVLAIQFIKPAPPEQIRMATGSETGAYHQFAQQYAALLAQERIRVELVPTEGSIENIALLNAGDVDIAFVQSGTASADASTLRGLGSLYYEPIWLFHRGELQFNDLTGLKGLRIAVGTQGSGTRPVALRLLTDNGISAENSRLLAMNGEAAAEGLIRGDLDAAFFIASARSKVVDRLLRTEGISLMSFNRADAYTRRHRHLSRVKLPRGVIDLKNDIPLSETTLLSASANLVATEALHPALIDLFLQAADTIHGEGGWFEKSGQFPSPDHLDQPLLKEAERYYRYGPPFLQRYLPFWAATLVDRLKVMILPLIALILPLIKIMPPIYRWRMRSRIYRWYRDILAVDRQLHEQRIDTATAMASLRQVEEEVAGINVPLSFADELYDLQLHISLVKQKLHEGGTHD